MIGTVPTPLDRLPKQIEIGHNWPSGKPEGDSLAKKLTQNLSAKRKGEQLVMQGLVLLDDRNNDQAVEHFRQAILVGREAITPYMKNLFTGFVLNRRHHEAVTIGRPLTAFFPKDYALFNDLGNQFRHLGKAELAQKCYKKAIELNQDWDIPYLNMAALSAKVEKYDDEIIPLLHRFDNIRDFVLPPYNGRPDFLDRIEAELAVESGGSKIEGAPKRPVSPAEIIDYFKKKALDAIDLARERNPKAVESAEKHLINLTLYSIEQQEFAQAMDGASQFAKLGSHYPYAEMMQAVILGRQGKLEEAIEILKVSVRRYPQDRYVNANLGLALRAIGKNRLAKVYFVRAGFLLEQSFGFFSSQEIEIKAQEHYQARHFSEAEKLYQLVIDTDPRADAWYLMARCQHHQQNHSLAFQTLKKGLDVANGELAKRDYAAQAQEFLIEEANKSVETKRLEKALSLMEYALYFGRKPELLDRASQVAYQLGDTFKSGQYQQEYNQVMGLDRDSQQEAKRQKYIAQGKEALSKKDFQTAIHLFEQAFDLKLDKDVFVFLASIYKKLKYQRALTALISRWKWMQEREDKRNLGQTRQPPATPEATPAEPEPFNAEE